MYVFFSTHYLPRILNDTLYIIEQWQRLSIIPTDAVQFGVQGQSPGGGPGALTPEAERLFLFSESESGITTGEGGHHQ